MKYWHDYVRIGWYQLLQSKINKEQFERQHKIINDEKGVNMEDISLDQTEIFDDIQIAGKLLENSENQNDDLSGIFQDLGLIISNYLMFPSRDNADFLLENIKKESVKFYLEKILLIIEQTTRR